MVFNCLDWTRDSIYEKLHPTQKPVEVLKQLIEIFTDKGDAVIDPCAGSGSTLVASLQLDRRYYGFEIKKDFHRDANKWIQDEIMIKKGNFNIPIEDNLLFEGVE
jgi:site-specific DNA-methyltransferase (adenine-specific)